MDISACPKWTLISGRPSLRTRMKKNATKLPPPKPVPKKRRFPPDHAISKLRLIELLRTRRVEKIVIAEADEDQFWLGVMIADELELRFLATRRVDTEPRLFKRLDVIKRFLRREVGLEGAFTLILNTKLNSLKRPAK